MRTPLFLLPSSLWSLIERWKGKTKEKRRSDISFRIVQTILRFGSLKVADKRITGQEEDKRGGGKSMIKAGRASPFKSKKLPESVQVPAESEDKFWWSYGGELDVSNEIRPRYKKKKGGKITVSARNCLNVRSRIFCLCNTWKLNQYAWVREVSDNLRHVRCSWTAQPSATRQTCLCVLWRWGADDSTRYIL